MTEEENRLLLLVDHDPAQIRLISFLASRAGWRTVPLEDGADALALLSRADGQQPDALLLDAQVAGEETCRLICQLRGVAPDLPILLLTGSTSPLLAVQALRAGAADYLIKPIASERLLYALESSARGNSQRTELAPLTEKIDSPPDFDMMIGSAPDYRASLARAAKAARGHNPILICGEPGTGKEILARAIHSASPRSRNALHVLHAAGMAPGHLESALYGHERGAFAGAFDRRIGALEEGDGGTLLIDDIERLPPPLQKRLAHTMATGEVKPLGARHSFRVDVRIIATACAAGSAMVRDGIIDKALCDLCASTEIALPPLRDRKGEIAALCRHFLSLIGRQPGLRRLSITDDAISLLEAYEWPGNLRQLQAVLFRAAVFCDGEALTRQDFPHLLDIVGDQPVANAPVAGGVTLFGPDGHLRSLEEIEADVIRLAIGHYRGRMSEVARRLGIGRSTLYRKLSELGIDNAA